jgi:hypothetical protein
MLGVDDVLIGGRYCIGLIRLISLINLLGLIGLMYYKVDGSDIANMGYTL